MKLSKASLGFGILGLYLSLAEASMRDFEDGAILTGQWGVYNLSHTTKEIAEALEKEKSISAQNSSHHFCEKNDIQNSQSSYKPMSLEEMRERWNESPLRRLLNEEKIEGFIKLGIYPYSTKSEIS